MCLLYKVYSIKENILVSLKGCLSNVRIVIEAARLINETKYIYMKRIVVNSDYEIIRMHTFTKLNNTHVRLRAENI